MFGQFFITVTVFFSILVGTLALFDDTARDGFRLFPASPTEKRGIVLRSFHLLFIVALFLNPIRRVNYPIVRALLAGSALGLIVFGLAFRDSNPGQARFGFYLLGLAVLEALLFPAVDE